ncbi:MAG: TIGR01458 family HAD-type hydrolase, partial [Gammaproteobacteria bacterium]|nr:TIGR01458 family HAD-type hydrolase [Gammaproteobacteria bacterium]
MLDKEVVGRGILIDLDGVIYQSDRLIAGAVDALDWIRQQQIPHLFVTNTTSRSREALLDKFESLGFSAQIEEVMTPVVAATQWLDQHELHSAALFVPSGT